GGGDGLPPGAGPVEGPDSRALSECGRAGAGDLGGGGGQPTLLPAGSGTAERDAGRRPRGDSPVSPALESGLPAGTDAAPAGNHPAAAARRADRGAAGRGRPAPAGRYDPMDAGGGFAARLAPGAGGNDSAGPRGAGGVVDPGSVHQSERHDQREIAGRIVPAYRLAGGCPLGGLEGQPDLVGRDVLEDLEQVRRVEADLQRIALVAHG